MLNPVTVAYSGIEGSFASISISKIFPDAERVSYKNFRDAYEAVAKGECDVAVLPIENSFAGDVGQVQDLMFNGNLYVDGVYELSVCQCLLGVAGTTIESIKTVISHPQALEQCNEYIFDHNYKTIQAENTARAAKDVAGRNDITIGAIASKETASIYGLNVLAKGINQSSQNTTRFAVFTRKRRISETPDKEAHILMFTVTHHAGSLAKAMAIIGNYNYNMRVIKSRPLRNDEENWTYYFYTELEGDINSDNGKAMLKELENYCKLLKVVGSYEPNKVL